MTDQHALPFARGHETSRNAAQRAAPRRKSIAKRILELAHERGSEPFKINPDPTHGRFRCDLSAPYQMGRIYLDNLRDRKGGDPSEWPKDLRVREFPRTST